MTTRAQHQRSYVKRLRKELEAEYGLEDRRGHIRALAQTELAFEWGDRNRARKQGLAQANMDKLAAGNQGQPLLPTAEGAMNGR